MPCSSFEDEITLTIDLVEAIIPQPGDSALPYYRLKKIGRKEERNFRIIGVENDLVRYSFAPDLGGRLISIFSKVEDQELMPPLLETVEEGPRGVTLLGGLEFGLQGQTRHTSLGTVRDRSDDDDDLARIELGETCLAPGFSYRIIASLGEGVGLSLETRVTNRTLSPLDFAPCWIWTYEKIVEGTFFDSRPWFSGFTLHFPTSPWTVVQRKGRAYASPPRSSSQLSPRTTTTSIVEVFPSIDKPHNRLANFCSYKFTDTELIILPMLASDVEIFVMPEKSTQQLKASMSFRPLQSVHFPFSELGGLPANILVRDTQGRDLLSYAKGGKARVAAERKPLENPYLDLTKKIDEDIAWLEDSPTYRATVASLRARNAFRSGDPEEAALQAELSLLYNGDDAIAWIEQTMAKRLHRWDPEAERPELLNAHFLSPWEPLLRAETFFSQPVPEGTEGSPLLGPLEAFPEEFLEVACYLIEAGLWQETSRWLEEALRHVKMPMLHYLMAYSYLIASRMEAEAAHHLRLASQLPFGSPLPWRKVEAAALGLLSSKYPDDEALARYAVLAPTKNEELGRSS